MISLFAAFNLGLKDVYKNKKLVLIFFLIQFIFAYVLTKPFSDLLTKAFSKTTLSDAILNNFNLIYFYTMFKEFGQGVSLFGLFLPAVILYVLITIFLTAGVYWLFFSKSEFRFSDFLLSQWIWWCLKKGGAVFHWAACWPTLWPAGYPGKWL